MEKLKDIAKISTGYTFRSRIKDEGGGFPVIQAKDVQDNVVNEGQLPLVDLPSNKAPFVEDGDIILTSRGSFKAARYKAKDDQPAIASSSVYVIKVTHSDYTAGFITLHLNSSYARSYFSKLAAGGAIASLRINDLRSLQVPQIPLAQQHRLIEFYDNIQQQKTLNERKMALINEIYNTAFNKSIKGAA